MRLLLLLFTLPVICDAQDSTLLYSIDHRIELASQRIMDDRTEPVFTPDFILADVDTAMFGTRRFTNFSGDLSGRYLEVMSLLPKRVRLEAKLPQLMRRIVGQQHEDGRFGDPTLAYVPDSIGREHMAQLWGNGRLLVGLMTYHQKNGDSLSLEAARRLGDFFLDSAMVADEPAVISRLSGQGAHGIICYTQFIEGLVMLYQSTRSPRYLEAAQQILPSLPERGQQHSHGYLTTLRGALMLAVEADDEEALAFVRESVDELMLSEDYTIFGTVNEYFGGRGDRDEGCSTADWVRLTFALHRITRDSRYLEAAQFAYFNSLLANQYATGDFGNHHFTDHTVATPQPHRAWWCCTMHGLRALLDIRKNYQFTHLLNVATLQLLAEGEYAYRGDAIRVELVSRTDSAETYRIALEDWFDKRFWILDAHRNMVIRQGGTIQQKPFYPDDRYEIMVSVTYPLRFHPQPGRAINPAEIDAQQTGYLTYGPFLMGIRDRDYVAEPDWENTIDPRSIRSGSEPYTLRASYRHGGYNGRQEVELVPVASQMEAGHPFLRVKTNYGPIGYK